MGKSDNKKVEKQSKDSKKSAVKVPKSSKDILADAKVQGKPAAPVKESSKKVKKVETKKPAPKGKGKESSSDESSESSSEDEKPKAAQVKAAPVRVAPVKAAPAKKESSSSSDDSSDSEEEKPKAKPFPSKAPAAKKAASSSSSSSSSDSDSDSSESEDEGKPVVVKSQTATKVEKKKEAVSDSEDSSDSVDESPQKASSSSSEEETSSEKKTSFESSESSDSSDSSDSSEDEDADVKMAEVKANGATKRKANDNNQPIAKKVKLANGDAAPAEESAEQTKAIFVGQLSWSIDNDRLAQEFADCGEVESATVQIDRNTGKSRGFGYVHFTTTAAVEKALLMNGQEIDGRAIKVDRSAPRDVNKDRQKRAQAFGDTQSPPSATLFVGNLSFSASEDAVWGLFGDYGVKSVRLPTDRETGRPKGFCYVEFEDIDGAKRAFESLNSADLEGRNIRLDYSQPRDSSGGGGGGFGGGRGGGRGGFGNDRGGGRGGGRGGFGGDRGRGGGRGGRGFDRGGRGGGRGGPPRARTGGIASFEGKKTTF